MFSPLILDLYSGAGGAGMGYSRAGFRVLGVDNRPQPHYPFEFILGDALDTVARLIAGQRIGEYVLSDFAAIHASPPCQAYSRAGRVFKKSHPDMIPDTRRLLIESGKPYLIENVEYAPLKASLLLCGSMFGLHTRRHRLFETNIGLYFAPRSCSCDGEVVKGNLLNYHNTAQRNLYLQRHNFSDGSSALKESIGATWMSFGEALEAIPPAYTQFIGVYLMDYLERTR